jgi:DNA ligase (NAD+)
MPRNEFQKLIESNGGRFASGVSSKLNHLICGEDSGSKRDKAEFLGISIISEKEFMDML